MSDRLILVDEQDRPVGHEEKLRTHRKGLLHRAFSIFVINGRGEHLLQQRARGKYHSGGLWSNACCSHPRAEEDLAIAVQRRLDEELGLRCETKKVLELTYDLPVGGGLTEHEYNHSYVARIDDSYVVRPNPAEVAAVKWLDQVSLEAEMTASPELFSTWFRHIYPKIKPFLAP